jgi:hypothetical protein
MSAVIKVPEPTNQRSSEQLRPELLPFLDTLAALIADQIIAERSAEKHNHGSVDSEGHGQSRNQSRAIDSVPAQLDMTE